MQGSVLAAKPVRPPARIRTICHPVFFGGVFMKSLEAPGTKMARSGTTRSSLITYPSLVIIASIPNVQASVQRMPITSEKTAL
jgi:hypothetical protein